MSRLKGWGVVAVALAGVGPGAALATAPFSGPNKIQYRDFAFERLATPHFDLHFYAEGKPLAARAAIVAEDAYAEYATLLEHEIDARIPLVLYVSHNDFQQTNTFAGPVDENTGGFTEAFRRRVVLPFQASQAEFQHVLRHEIAHVFLFDMLYGKRLDSVVARRTLQPVPLWFAEGLAEHLANPVPGRLAFVRDALVHERLPGIENSRGGMAYGIGESAFAAVADLYGAAKVPEIVRAFRHTRDIEVALEATIGIGLADFENRWRDWLARRTWPEHLQRQPPQEVARRLAGHGRDAGDYSSQPALSPDSERLACVSSRGGVPEIVVRSTVDGRILRRLVRGEISPRFESLHGFSSGLDWNPSGTAVAFVAKSRGRETLFVLDARTGNELHRLRLDLDTAASPCWAPEGEQIVLVGVTRGQTDLFRVDLRNGVLENLTEDEDDEADPCWFPDGRRIVFSRQTVGPPGCRYEASETGEVLRVASRAGGREEPAAKSELAILDLDGRRSEALVSTPGDDRAPSVTPNGTGIYFASETDGVFDLYHVDVTTRELRRLTAVSGGVMDPHLARDGRRLAFMNLDAGTWNVFVVDDVAGLHSGSVTAPVPLTLRIPLHENGTAAEDIALAEHDAAGSAVPPSAEKEGEGTLLGSVRPYRHRLRPEYLGGNVGYSSFYGPAGGVLLSVSDLLGNHRIEASFDVYGAVRDANALLAYHYMPKRIDYAFGLFHFRDYRSSSRLTVGEPQADEGIFSERDVGAFASASYPFSTFTRLDVEISTTYARREFFQRNPETGDLDRLRLERRGLSQPTLTFVHDTARFGADRRPRAGSRSYVSIAPALPLGQEAVQRTSIALDARRYWELGRRSALAGRILGGFSFGRDELTYYLGGPATLRGFGHLEFAGSRVVLGSLEYRFPLVDLLVLGWPGPWRFGPMGGVAFFDIGSAWSRADDDARRFFTTEGGFALRDAHADYGVGLRAPFSILHLKLDFAWPTDLRRTRDVRQQFSIGFDF